ncbi:MAG: RluA family pseudouridine synthase [Gemmataceae bacterium]
MELVVNTEQHGSTLAALLRLHLPDRSWSQVRRLIETRHLLLNGELCLDAARRVKEGDTLKLLEESAPKPRQPEQVVIRFLDEHIVVVEKPAGISTVRHPAERNWTAERRALDPTLDDLVHKLIVAEERRSPGYAAKKTTPRLRIVHRLDKATSGLLVFARSVEAERELGKQFARHSAKRRYLALVPGHPRGQTIRSRLVRDRADGRRGSTDAPDEGKEAVTHIEIVEQLKGYTLLSCQLETGRTHQIRIHLAELGHPICGEAVYHKRPDGTVSEDRSNAPRLCLHATELGFVHPITGEAMHWTMALPDDLEQFVRGLRRKKDVHI